MKELRCLIADDEPLAIDLIVNFLTRLDIRNITRCANGIEAFQVLQQSIFDVVFLDIAMPQLSGIELLKNISSRPLVVLTTAYRDYAVEGYELDVLDYLVKPFSFARFVQTMEKVVRAGAHMTGEQGGAGKNGTDETGAWSGREATASPGARVESGEGDEFLFLKADRQLVKVKLEEILYIESKKDYIQVNTARGKWLCNQSLTEMTAKLPAAKFFRLHRSYTVALNKIDFVRSDSCLIAGKTIPVSRENRQELRRRLSPAG